MNASKTIWIARLIAACLLLVAPFAHSAEFSTGRGISFDQWVTWPNTARWNDPDVLGNFPEWQNFITNEEIAKLVDAGFTTVRVPVDPAFYLFGNEAGRQSTILQGVHKAINRITSNGLNVVLDLHTIPRGDESDAVGTSQILNNDLIFVSYLNFVAKISKELTRYDTKQVALELINEPQYECGQSDLAALWQAQLSQLHATAREANPAITLVLPGACYASADGLAQIDPKNFNDDNIIWAFHSYEPFILTHQSAKWVGKPISAFRNLPYPPSHLKATSIFDMPDNNKKYIDSSLSGITRFKAGWYIRNEMDEWGSEQQLKEYLERPFATVAAWAKQNDIALQDIFLGEFGFIAQEYGNDFKTEPTWRIAYLKDMIGLADKYGFGWSIWSYGGAFGMAQSFGGEPMPGDLLQRLNLQSTN